MLAKKEVKKNIFIVLISTLKIILTITILGMLNLSYLFLVLETDSPHMSINDCIRKQNKSFENIYELTCDPGEFALSSQDYDLLEKLTNLEKIKFIGISNKVDAYHFFSKLTKLKKLTTVEIEDSHFVEIDKLGDIENLRNLSIIGKTFGGKSFQVKDLNLLSTDSRFNGLQSLTLKDIDIEEIPDLSKLQNLQKLSISGIELTSISSDSVNWENIKRLELSGTRITSLDNKTISNLTNLQSLDVSYSSISDINFVLDLPNLQEFIYRGRKKTVDMECIKTHPNYKESWIE